MKDRITSTVKFSKYMDIDQLHSVMRLLDKMNIRYWIDQGTLLALYRDGKPMHWDFDYDLGIIEENVEEIIRLQKFISQSFSQAYYDFSSNSINITFHCENKKQWDIRIAVHSREEDRVVKKWPKHGNRLGWILKTIIVILSRLHYCLPSQSAINILKRLQKIGLKSSKSPNIIIRLLSHARNVLIRISLIFIILLPRKLGLKIFYKISNSLPKVKLSTPEHYFRNIRKLRLGGYEYPMPADIEGYLQFKYGDDWRVPCQNWNYMVDDGALVDK